MFAQKMATQCWPWVDLLSVYDYDDLAPLVENARQVEQQVRLQIAEDGVQLHEYQTFSEFEQAQNESGIR